MEGNSSKALDGKVALVTGAARGVGRGIALECARQGATVVVADIGTSLDGHGTNQRAADEVAAEIIDGGGIAIGTDMDVTDVSAVAASVEEAVGRFGGIDILVNNAGILRPNWLWDIDPADFEAVVRVHVMGQFNTMHTVVPYMRERGYGRVVNLTSAGALGHPLQASYSAAKMAVIGLTYASAIELTGSGVTVNAIGPSQLTRMSSAAAGMSEDELKSAPAPVAPLVAYVASEKADYLNGHVMMMDLSYEPGTFHLFSGPVIVETLRRDDDALWSVAELDDAIKGAFGNKLTPPGQAPRDVLEAYVEKMTGLLDLPNYWNQDSGTRVA